MIELKFENRTFRVPESDLERIGKECEKEMLDKEKAAGIIHDMRFFEAASQLRVADCFACGSFEDYTGNCRYESKVKATIGKERKGLCKRADLISVYAIKSGKLNAYEVKEDPSTYTI